MTENTKEKEYIGKISDLIQKRLIESEHTIILNMPKEEEKPAFDTSKLEGSVWEFIQKHMKEDIDIEKNENGIKSAIGEFIKSFSSITLIQKLFTYVEANPIVKDIALSSLLSIRKVFNI